MNYVSEHWDVYRLKADIEKAHGKEVYYWHFPIEVKPIPGVNMTDISLGKIKFNGENIKLLGSEEGEIVLLDVFICLMDYKANQKYYNCYFGIADTYEEAVAGFNADIQKRLDYLKSLTESTKELRK